MGATLSPERPFYFGEKAYWVRDLEAAVTTNNKDVEIDVNLEKDEERLAPSM